jgi:hypothetical protein
LVGRLSRKCRHSDDQREDLPPRHKDTKGKLTGRTGRKGRKVRRKELGVRSEESGVRSQACRGDLALIPHLSSIIRNSNREVREIREERFHHKGAKGTKGRPRAKDNFEC